MNRWLQTRRACMHASLGVCSYHKVCCPVSERPVLSSSLQVQQRRTRLQHACQHSIIAAGRKLLLILLQQLWAELLQAADRAAGAAAATVVEEATAAADSRAFAAPAASLEGLAAELAGGVPQRAASATERSGARAAAAAAAAAATGRALGGLAGARSAPSPLPPAVSPSPAGSVGAAVLSVSPGVASTARRQPRYAGRLADLAEGLGDEETHLDLDSLDPDSELNRNLDPAGRGLLGLPAISDLESVLGDVARLREREGRAGRHGGGGAGGVGFGGAGLSGRSFPGGSYGYNNDDDDRRLQLHTWHGRSAADVSGSAGEEEEGEDVVGGGWDDALRVSPSARLRLSSTIGAFGGSSSSGSGSGSAGARDTLSNRLRQSSAPAPDHGATTDLLGSGGRAAAATATTAALLSAALPSIGGHDRAGRRSLSVAFPSSSSAANAGAGAGVAAAATAAVGADSSAGARPPRGAVARRSMAALWESPAGMGLAGGSSSGLGSSSRATATDSNTGAAAAGELDQRHSAPADREARISRILNRSSVASSSCGMLGICSGAGGGGLGGACGTACVAARAEQAEQLQVLQVRCPCAFSPAVHNYLDACYSVDASFLAYQNSASLRQAQLHIQTKTSRVPSSNPTFLWAPGPAVALPAVPVGAAEGGGAAAGPDGGQQEGGGAGGERRGWQGTCVALLGGG